MLSMSYLFIGRKRKLIPNEFTEDDVCFVAHEFMTLDQFNKVLT